MSYTYQSIVSMGDSINDMLIDKPELFEQIFGANSLPANITIDELQTKHIQQFYAAQKWLDYFEIILVTWPSIPEHLHKPWREYIKSYLGESPFLQFIVLNTQWYGSNLKQLCYEGINEKQKITQPVSPADPGPVASSV